MVSNASDDFPEPETPVIVISLFLGISISIFWRLWVFTHWKVIFVSKPFIGSSIFFFDMFVNSKFIM
jgi:hypothetical protein